MFKRPLVLMLAGLMAACTPSIDGLVHDKTFHQQALQSGGITIAGTTAETGKADKTNLHIYSELLREQLQAELKGVEINPENELIYALNAEQQALILDEFLRRGTLSMANLNLLQQRLKTRFIALVRIDGNEIIEDRVSTDETRNSSGKLIRPASTTSQRSRRMHTSLYLFDLQSGKRVWGGRLTTERSNSKSYEHSNTAVNLIRGIAALSKGMDSAYPYPPAPAESELLKTTFAGFAENLAKLK